MINRRGVGLTNTETPCANVPHAQDAAPPVLHVPTLRHAIILRPVHRANRKRLSFHTTDARCLSLTLLLKQMSSVCSRGGSTAGSARTLSCIHSSTGNCMQVRHAFQFIPSICCSACLAGMFPLFCFQQCVVVLGTCMPPC